MGEAPERARGRQRRGLRAAKRRVHERFAADERAVVCSRSSRSGSGFMRRAPRPSFRATKKELLRTCRSRKSSSRSSATKPPQASPCDGRAVHSLRRPRAPCQVERGHGRPPYEADLADASVSARRDHDAGGATIRDADREHAAIDAARAHYGRLAIASRRARQSCARHRKSPPEPSAMHAEGGALAEIQDLALPATKPAGQPYEPIRIRWITQPGAPAGGPLSRRRDRRHPQSADQGTHHVMAYGQRLPRRPASPVCVRYLDILGVLRAERHARRGRVADHQEGSSHQRRLLDPPSLAQRCGSSKRGEQLTPGAPWRMPRKATEDLSSKPDLDNPPVKASSPCARR